MEFIDQLKGLEMFKGLGEADILAKVKSLSNEAAKVEGLEARIAQLENQLQTVNDEAKEAFLNQAVSDGRIKSDQKDHYRKLMDADEATTRSLINGMPKAAKPSITDYLNGGKSVEGSKDLAQMTWDEIDKAERLGELKEKFPDLYRAKFQEKFTAAAQ